MIKNERQYRITKAQAQKFEQALADLQQAEDAKQENPLLWQVQREAIESQLKDLQEELAEFEALIDQSSNQPVVWTLNSLNDLPAALIQARLAAGLTQKALAEQLGMKEQQIQRYEATDYATASLGRIVSVSHVLGLELKSGLTVRVRPPHQQQGSSVSAIKVKTSPNRLVRTLRR